MNGHPTFYISLSLGGIFQILDNHFVILLSHLDNSYVAPCILTQGIFSFHLS